jgi:hypothetical protein
MCLIHIRDLTSTKKIKNKAWGQEKQRFASVLLATTLLGYGYEDG